MKKAQPSQTVDTFEKPGAGEQAEIKPQGIGMAVAFDWGLAVQVLVTPFLPLFFKDTGYLKSLKMSPLLTTTVSLLTALPFVALLAIFGEGVRRGWRWTRPVQITVNLLLSFVGFYPLVNLWRDSKVGNYWSLVPTVILLLFSPLIVWRLSRPVTARWFATVTSAEARKRHGGLWLGFILLWSVLGGLLEVIASISR